MIARNTRYRMHIMVFALAVLSGVLTTAFPLGNSTAFPAEKYYDIKRSIKAGDIADVRKYIEEGANINSEDVMPIYNALLYAPNKTEMVQFLIDAGADVNARDSIGSTPLHHALLSERLTKILLDEGADVMAKDNNGNTPLHYAAFGNSSILEMIIQHSDSWFNSLLGRKNNQIDINVRNSRGMTPLHMSAMYGNPLCASVLIENGADINAKDNEGLTPLQRAAKRYNSMPIKEEKPGYVMLIKLLVKHGARQSCRRDSPAGTESVSMKCD